MIGQYPLIPLEAFLYFPEPDEILQIRNNKPYRVIFDGGVPFTKQEEFTLSALKTQIKKEKKYHHLEFISDAQLMRYLQATKYDLKDCMKALKEFRKWEEKILPLTLKPQIQSLLEKGLIYMLGRDNKFRPIFVFNLLRIIEMDLKQKVFLELLGYFFQYAVENCMLEGQVETWVTITDLGKISMFSMGGTVINTITFLSCHFSYLVNCPGSISFFWSMAKRAMSEDQIQKITLLEQNILPKQAFSQINPQQIQKKYGGVRPDLTDFWPIKPLPMNILPSQRPPLVSAEYYNQMHLQGLLVKKKVSLDLIKPFHGDKRIDKIGVVTTARSEEIGMEQPIQIDEFQEENPPQIPEMPIPFNIPLMFNFIIK